MPVLALLLFLQASLEWTLLEAEDSRAADPAALIQALANPTARIQRIAVRALGRLERPEHANAVMPLLDSPSAQVRREAFNALGQMGATMPLAPYLDREKDGTVRGVIFETLGRLPQADVNVLVRGLADEDANARIGAARGLESYYRRNSRIAKPPADVIAALRAALKKDVSPILRELVLLTLNSANDADPDTLNAALQDPNPQVRRLAVIALRQWRDDTSPIVRYEALRVAGNCERAVSALNDPSDHVALLAIDQLGNGCAPAPLEVLVEVGRDWRRQAHALVSLAKTNPDSARRRLGRFVSHPTWQARVYAAEAAKILKDAAALQKLLRDKHPNVVRAALTTAKDAVDLLQSTDYGLLLEAARLLRGAPEGTKAVRPLLAALRRVSGQKAATSRDPRMQILERLREFGDASTAKEIEYLLSDFDPAIAKKAAEILSEKSGAPVSPRTTRFVTAPPPAEAFLRGLQRATAWVRIAGRGSFTLELIADEAPVTAATFVQLAENGYYNGLTFHRVVPNFVIQGGSPGANEYVGTPGYLRDELGLLSHLRGAVGISTRGRDTGDSQIFVNLVDNFRLDHNYTVFARVIDGIGVVDAIQEGDTIESIEIIRAAREPQ